MYNSSTFRVFSRAAVEVSAQDPETALWPKRNSSFGARGLPPQQARYGMRSNTCTIQASFVRPAGVARAPCKLPRQRVGS